MTSRILGSNDAVKSRLTSLRKLSMVLGAPLVCVKQSEVVAMGISANEGSIGILLTVATIL